MAENPLSVTELSTQEEGDLNRAAIVRSELEATLQGLKDGEVSEQQAAAVLERLMVDRAEDAVDRLRKELSTVDVAQTMLGPLVQTIFAHMTEAPTNVTIFPKDDSAGCKCLAFVGFVANPIALG